MTMEPNHSKRIAILGGGPAGLFVYKRLVDGGRADLDITIYEKSDRLGAGMPYGPCGARDEHITNVSDIEVPELVTSIGEWIQDAPTELLRRFSLSPERFNEYKVLPRLLFGEYLSAQFELLRERAEQLGIRTTVRLTTTVTDLVDEPGNKTVKVVTSENEPARFEAVVISTGHYWPRPHEGKVPGYFDSPYPPAKLALQVNHPVAIRGASLTAMDALRTLARHNGTFNEDEDGLLSYELAPDSPHFRLVLHALHGLLPAIRFHLEDPQQEEVPVLSEEELWEVKEKNGGFVPLDYLFERNFKRPLAEREPDYHEKIKDMTVEEFVAYAMSLRERLDAFQLFKAEYAEAEKSIQRRRSVYWKEMLLALSFALNYPAKHLSAEDMLRLKRVLQPLISIIIASAPQSSCRELLALYDAGVLSLVPVDADSRVEPRPEGGIIYHYTDEAGQAQAVRYPLFIDCIGQPQFMAADFPFPSLRDNGGISQARLRFQSAEAGEKERRNGNDDVERDADGHYYLRVPGVTINDHFQLLDQYGAYNDRLFIMAVPYIGGYNPDYSGLDFCEEASERIVARLLQSESISESALDRQVAG